MKANVLVSSRSVLTKSALSIFLAVLLVSNIAFFLHSSMSRTTLLCEHVSSPGPGRPSELPSRETANSKRGTGHVVFDCISGMKLRDAGPADSDLTPFQFDFAIGLNVPVTESPEHRSRIFMNTFQQKAWGTGHDPQYKGVQASGQGSTLDAAQRMIAMLHVIVERIKNELGRDSVRILDAPCGDMAWMTKFLQIRPDIHYTGVDIVPDLIQIHKKTFQGMKNRDFFIHDIAKSPLKFSDGPFDLILNRHCLQHITIRDGIRALSHFESTGSRYLLTTTWPFTGLNVPFNNKTDFENPGRTHELNLEIPPYKLSPPLCMNLDGKSVAFAGLWRFPLKQVANCDERHLKVDKILKGQKQPMMHC